MRLTSVLRHSHILVCSPSFIDREHANRTELAYVDVDYTQYCQDCSRLSVGIGQNSATEAAIRNTWGPTDRGTLRIDTPTTLVDRNGVIMSWILPEALLPQFQVSSLDHTSVSILQGYLHDVSG